VIAAAICPSRFANRRHQRSARPADRRFAEIRAPFEAARRVFVDAPEWAAEVARARPRQTSARGE